MNKTPANQLIESVLQGAEPRHVVRQLNEALGKSDLAAVQKSFDEFVKQRPLKGKAVVELKKSLKKGDPTVRLMASFSVYGDATAFEGWASRYLTQYRILPTQRFGFGTYPNAVYFKEQ